MDLRSITRQGSCFLSLFSFALCLGVAAGAQDCLPGLEAAGAGCLVDCGPATPLTGGWAEGGNASVQTYEVNLLDQMAEGGLGLPGGELELTGGETWLNETLLIVEARCSRDPDAPMDCRVGGGSCVK